ncbi:MAG: hypothetical protein DRN91_02115 [Candidatus Alkanophagales archaeon]|nr:MAG: hypothetical protein DRN91_02115 [Candidatus Alkanophagales archaeon]
MRVLVIGLDGACIDLIERWAGEGKLPTFEKLLSEGSYGRLESVTPPLTVPAWNCLACGKNPAKIGRFSFVQKVPGTYDFRINLPSVRRERAVWDILSDHGMRVFVLNAPNVLSAYRINGYMVAGFLCLSEERLAYPKELKEELRRTDYYRGAGYLLPFLTLSDNELSEMLMRMTDAIHGVLFRFLEERFDFGFVVFQELDGAQHKFWNDERRVLRHYQNIDRKLRKILDKVGDETDVLIASDHGFGPNKRVFFINEWLRREGLLSVREPFLPLMMNALIRAVKVQNVLRILKVMKAHSLAPFYERLLRQAMRTSVVRGETKAFSYGNWGMIYINLKGREPEGVVEAEEYERLRSEIIEKLQQISVKAYRREEVYHGEYLNFAPDIIVSIDENVTSISGKIGLNRVFMEGFPYNGYHRMDNGTFIAWGPDIKSGRVQARIYDIAPTILHIFGVPIPRDVDGRILREIFKGELATRETKYESEMMRVKGKVKKLKMMKRI